MLFACPQHRGRHQRRRPPRQADGVQLERRAPELRAAIRGSHTNQMQRSFEDTALKQRALELVAAA